MDKSIVTALSNPHIPCWTNASNQETFYGRELSVRLLRKYAVETGLDTGCDIDLIFPYIRRSSSLLEVGGGYGRVVRKLLEKNYQGEINVVEKSRVSCRELAENFQSNIVLNETDILKFKTEKQFQSVLSMWSGVADFSREEQQAYASLLFSCCAPGGLLILDTANSNKNLPHAISTEKQYYSIVGDGFFFNGYIAEKDEILLNFQKAGFALLDYLEYVTNKSICRRIFVFQK